MSHSDPGQLPSCPDSSNNASVHKVEAEREREKKIAWMPSSSRGSLPSFQRTGNGNNKGGSASPVKAASRPGTPSRGATPTAALDLTKAPGVNPELHGAGEAANGKAGVRNIPAGCGHLTSLLGLGLQPTTPAHRIKAEPNDNDQDELDNFDSLTPLVLGEKAQVYLQRYVAGLRWGSQIRSGDIKMMDEEEREAELARFAADDTNRRKRPRLEYPRCHSCDADIVRPYICLECAYTACFTTSDDQIDSLEPHNHIKTSHMIQHLQTAKHALAFDMIHGTLYCFECKDAVIDPVFETVLRRESGRVTPRQKGRSFGSYTSSLSALPSYAINAAAVPCRMPRGLRNMGATCFMNVIIQAFLHNPLMRNYFLADRHNPALCSGSKSCLACEMDKIFTEFYSGTGGVNGGGAKPPHGPTSFLYCMWMDQSSSEELTQAGQHDAHELFISALNAIHGALTGRALERSLLPAFGFEDENTLNLLFDHYDGAGASGSGTNSEDGTPVAGIGSINGHGHGGAGGAGGVASCPCVVHRTFAGQLQSDVTCQRCGQTNTTKDPMLDLSLDVRPEAVRRRESLANTGMSAVDAGKKKKNKAGKDDTWSKYSDLAAGTPPPSSGMTSISSSSAMEDEEEQHLTVCLQRYCSEERLGNDDYSCANCGVSSTATKQLSLYRLPPVLCIQLKRFEHTSSAAKIDTKVRFPVILDVRDFSTSVIRASHSAGNASVGNGRREDDDPYNDPMDGRQSGSNLSDVVNPDPEAYLYDLFTVVVHEGSMNTGHYTNYSRYRDNWYRFDDDKVVPTTLSTVLAARAYQLCYRRRRLKTFVSKSTNLHDPM